MKSKSLFVVMALLSAVGCGGKKKPDVAAQSADDPSQYKLVATTSAVYSAWSKETRTWDWAARL